MFSFKYGLARDSTKLPFYHPLTSWQTQWLSVKNGESIIISHEDGTSLGYAIFKRIFNEQVEEQTINLYPLEVNFKNNSDCLIEKHLLREIHKSSTAVKNIINYTLNNEKIVTLFT